MSQVVDFSDLRHENITPTDIDGFVEYKGKGFIIFEFKSGDAPYEESGGQGKALQRLCDILTSAGKTTYLLVCRHYTYPGDRVMAADSFVDKIRYRYRWHEWHQRETVAEVFQKIMQKGF